MLVGLGEPEARALHEAAGEDRATRETLALLGSGPRDLRGPFCSDCTVSWADVYHRADQPWPCPGPRPKALGGSVQDQAQELEPMRSRQQRRAARRAALRTEQVPASQVRGRAVMHAAAERARFVKPAEDGAEVKPEDAVT